MQEITEGIDIKNITLIFQSLTYAIKAQKKIRNSGITAEIIKLSTDNDEIGCTYGLNIPYTDYYTVIDVLKQSGIAFKALTEGKK